MKIVEKKITTTKEGYIRHWYKARIFTKNFYFVEDCSIKIDKDITALAKFLKLY